MLNYTDSHAHLSSPQVWPDIEEILLRADQAGVKHIVNICTDQDTLQKGLELAKRYPQVYNTAATTPHDVDKEGELYFPLFKQHAVNKDLIAIGETGLDYHYEHSPRTTQKHFFIKYLHLARETNLPVVIHCRDAFADFFEILDAEYKTGGQHLPGVLHCFTGTLAEAKAVIDRGWFLSLSGITTFKKSSELREVAKIVPLEQLFIETDTPYLAPRSRRGQRNEPAFLPETAQLIAELKGVPVEKVAHKTNSNVKQLFNL